MNCIEFLPFGKYLRPIQKMARGGQTHSGQKPDKTYPATLDIHKALTPAYQNWSEEAVFEISQHFDLDANDEAELENALQQAYMKATSPSIVRANRLEEMRVEKGEIDEQMAEGGKTASRGDGPPTMDGTLRGLEQFLQNTIRDIEEQKDRLTARQDILPNYPDYEEEMRQALQKLSQARYIALYELGPDYSRYKRAVTDFEGQGMSTREAKREAKKITGYKMEKGGTTASKPTLYNLQGVEKYGFEE